MSPSGETSGLAVELRQCSRRFGERIALRRVSLEVAPGERIALVGANGSGKSTLLRIVAGLTRPTAGEALVNGVAAVDLPRLVRGRIAYVAHRSLCYRGLTAAENLTLLARLARVDTGGVVAALDGVGLGDRAHDRIDGFSRGMLQRLALARVLLTDPALLLLDEPTTGLDTDGLALLDRVLNGTRATVLAATHDGVFAERHGGRAVRLAYGEVVA
jgi:heme ABC exporter ATP-binding subunit CcmA